jgi:hypothetical protein
MTNEGGNDRINRKKRRVFNYRANFDSDSGKEECRISSISSYLMSPNPLQFRPPVDYRRRQYTSPHSAWYLRFHRPSDSLFSWSSGFNDFGGFVNWGFLLLALGGSRLALENVLKYGVRIDPLQWVRFLSGAPDQPPSLPPSLILLACQLNFQNFEHFFSKFRNILKLLYEQIFRKRI